MKEIKIQVEENGIRMTYQDKLKNIDEILTYIDYFRKKDDLKILDITIEKVEQTLEEETEWKREDRNDKDWEEYLDNYSEEEYEKEFAREFIRSIKEEK